MALRTVEGDSSTTTIYNHVASSPYGIRKADLGGTITKRGLRLGMDLARVRAIEGPATLTLVGLSGAGALHYDDRNAGRTHANLILLFLDGKLAALDERSYAGFSLSGTASNTNSNTNTTTLTYQASTVTTKGKGTMNAVNIADCDNRDINPCSPCDKCHRNLFATDQFNVKILEDRIFGSQMFVDPQAPPEPRDFSLTKYLPKVLLRLPHPPAP